MERRAMRHMVIVARDRPELQEELVQQFASDPEVQVIPDRRGRERRQRNQLRLPDRRETDRRETGGDVMAKLWLAGYVIVRMD